MARGHRIPHPDDDEVRTRVVHDLAGRKRIGRIEAILARVLHDGRHVFFPAERFRAGAQDEHCFGVILHFHVEEEIGVFHEDEATGR